MSLPFDLEDVMGVALASLLKRFVWLWSCITLGCVIPGVSLMATGLVVGLWQLASGGGSGSLGMPDLEGVGLWLLLAVFFPFASLLGPLYGGFLLGMILYAFKSDEASPAVWGGGVVTTGLFTYAVIHEELVWWETAIAACFWLAFLAGLWFFIRWWAMRQRVLAELHLTSIAQENEMKREEMRKRTGGAVADREFAVGEIEDRRGPSGGS